MAATDAELMRLFLGDGAIPLAEVLTGGDLPPRRRKRLEALRELHRRLLQVPKPDRLRMTTPEEVWTAMRGWVTGLDHELLFCLPLDVRLGLIGQPIVISQGDVDGTVAGPRGFFRAALRAGATQAIAVHNHPSGDATPSQADMAVTRRLVAAGRTVDVPLSDHLIMTNWGHTSLFREHPN